MTKKKEPIKVYIRTFYFDDGSKKSVKSTDPEDMMGPTYRGAWARDKWGKDKIKEQRDTVEWR